MRLEKLVKSMLPLHRKVIDPFKYEIDFPIQASLEGLESPLNETKKAQVMGEFYERVNRAFYGGRLMDIRFGGEEESYNGDNAKPDIVDSKKRIDWESKAVHSSSKYNITRSQLEGYKSRQYNVPERLVLFSTYRHSLKGIKREDRTQKEIIKELSEGTLYSLVLPLSVILRLDDSGEEFVSHYEGGRSYPPTLTIRSPTLNSFFENPEETLSIIDFDPEDFEVKRYLSPKSLRVNGYRVSNFPVLFIKDKDHDKWVEEFIQTYEDEIERHRKYQRLSVNGESKNSFDFGSNKKEGEEMIGFDLEADAPF